MIKLTILSVLSLSTVVLPVSAQCPSNIAPTYPHWSFQDIQWTYTGALSSSAVSAGANTWNSRESFIAVQASTLWNDIGFTDDNTLPSNLAETTLYNYGQTGNSCYLHTSACSNICFNTSRLDYADVKLSPNNISGAGNGWASYWGLTVAQAVDLVVKMTAAHEIGHVLTLADWNPGASNCSSPTVLSVYDEFYCQLSGGATACDGANVGASYVGWTLAPRSCDYCSVGGPTCSN